MASVSGLAAPSVSRVSSRCASSFGCGTFDGNQKNPGHGDPVAFLHELGLREHTAVTRPKARRNTRL
jgi:hypothetical protein